MPHLRREARLAHARRLPFFPWQRGGRSHAAQRAPPPALSPPGPRPAVPPGNGCERSAIARGAGRRLPGPGSLRGVEELRARAAPGGAEGRGAGGRSGLLPPLLCARRFIEPNAFGTWARGRGSARRAPPSLGASRAGGRRCGLWAGSLAAVRRYARPRAACARRCPRAPGSARGGKRREGLRRSAGAGRELKAPRCMRRSPAAPRHGGLRASLGALW